MYNFEHIVLNEISQVEKEKHYLSFTWDLKKGVGEKEKMSNS